MRISQLDQYRHRNPGGYFQDLAWDVRQRAYQWLDRFIRRREASHGSVPAWLFAIYCGQAKRLALNPPDSAWGHRMLAKRGGLAVQRLYRLEGRHPTARATLCRVVKQRARKLALKEARDMASMDPPLHE
jgi:triphosphoribosyl-dephospho-CoA synthetase